MPIPTEQRPRLPWVYAGSHNLTRSAWGALEKGDSQFRMSNFECGVVLLPKNYMDWMNGDLKSKDHPEGIQEDDFCEPIDLPFVVPYQPYHSTDMPFCVECCVCSTLVLLVIQPSLLTSHPTIPSHKSFNHPFSHVILPSLLTCHSTIPSHMSFNKHLYLR